MRRKAHQTNETQTEQETAQEAKGVGEHAHDRHRTRQFRTTYTHAQLDAARRPHTVYSLGAQGESTVAASEFYTSNTTCIINHGEDAEISNHKKGV